MKTVEHESMRSIESRSAKAITPEETHKKGEAPLPGPADFANRQLGLFQTFLANTDEQRDNLSNAIDLWDSVPRYCVSRQAMTKARIQDKFLEEYSVEFQHRQKTYTCVIQPASVLDFDGVKRFFYPSGSEELVEDALRKLATEARAGYFDGANQRGGVTFTLHALRQEMARRGHTRSYQEIVQSLNILSHCVIEIRPHGAGERKIVSACLPMLAATSREQLDSDPDSKWAVQFHPLVASAIDRLESRQFDYHLMMSHSSQLTRWLHRQLVLKFVFADGMKPFEMRYSTIRRDSRLLENYKRERDAIDVLTASFKELENKKVISHFKREDERGPRKKLVEVVYTVRATTDFIREAKAANKRSQLHREALPGSRTPHTRLSGFQR